MRSRAILILALLISLASRSLYADHKADVVVQGKVTFQIGSTENLEAVDRANLVNERIQNLINSKKPIAPLGIRQINKDWEVYSGDTVLLTATKKDGADPEKVAQHWADLLNKALLPPKEPEGIFVTLYGRKLFKVGSTEAAQASERAGIINARLRSSVENRDIAPVKMEVLDRHYVITVGKRVLLTVTREDALNYNMSIPELAQRWTVDIRNALEESTRERTGKYLIDTSIQILVAFAALLFALWLLSKVRLFLHSKLEGIRKKALKEEKIEFGALIAVKILISWLFWLLCITLVVSFAYRAMELTPYTREYRESIISVLEKAVDTIKEAFTTRLFGIGETPISLKTILLIIVFIVLVVWFARATRKFLEEKLLVETRMDRGQAQAISTGVNYLMVLIGFIIGLRFAGIDLSALAVIAGAVGIGIGFGLQNIANNFVSGLIILVERPIQVGDRVELGNIRGDVVKINARSTTILTNDNIAVIVPNSNFISSTVINWSHLGDRRVRLAIKVGAAYGSDVRLVEKALLEAAHEHPHVLKDPAPSVRFMEFGDSALNFELRVWTVKLTNKPNLLRSDLNFIIFEKFKKNNIAIPYPQQDLHLRSAIPIEARIIEQVVFKEKEKEEEEVLRETPK